MLNIGVIGCGMVASYGHMPAVASSDKWRLMAVSDLDEERLERTRRDHDVPHGFTDYRELLALPALDAVAVATHVDTHHPITMDALARGLHVMCEKPMAPTSEQCREMVDAAAETGRLLAVNFNTRSGPVYREIKRHLATGAVGAVRLVRLELNWSCHQWKPIERMEKFMAGGGPIVDSGVHFFEGVRWFSGQEIEHIDATGVTLPPYDAPQHVIATCRLSGGAIALVETGWIYCKTTKDEGSTFRIDVVGDDGAISYDAGSSLLRVYTRDGTEEIKIEDLGKHFELVYDFFAQSVQRGELVELASGFDGWKATEASYRALAAAKQKD